MVLSLAEVTQRSNKVSQWINFFIFIFVIYILMKSKFREGLMLVFELKPLDLQFPIIKVNVKGHSILHVSKCAWLASHSFRRFYVDDKSLFFSSFNYFYFSLFTYVLGMNDYWVVTDICQ